MPPPLAPLPPPLLDDDDDDGARLIKGASSPTDVLDGDEAFVFAATVVAVALACAFAATVVAVALAFAFAASVVAVALAFAVCCLCVDRWVFGCFEGYVCCSCFEGCFIWFWVLFHLAWF